VSKKADLLIFVGLFVFILSAIMIIVLSRYGQISAYGYHWIGILLIIQGLGLLLLAITEILTQMALRRFIREFLRTAIIHHRR
jgi:hypothetical protein